MSTGFNVPPPQAHSHPDVKRSQRWVLVAIIILTIGTTFALWRQQVNFDEHKNLANEAKDTANRACTLALENRVAFEHVLQSFLDNMTTPEPIKVTLREQIAVIQQRERELMCNPK